MKHTYVTTAWVAVLLCLAAQAMRGGTPQATPDSTQYESTDSTPAEQAALIGANVLLVPLAIAATVVSIAPPSAGILIENGTSYATLGFESGVGLGTSMPTGRFADERLMVSYVHVYNPHQADIIRAEAVKDIHFGFIDRRHIILAGVSPFAGVFARGAERGYSAGASLHGMIPSLPYIGLFPLHTIGITYRYNRYFNGGSFHTIALGFAAALIF